MDVRNFCVSGKKIGDFHRVLRMAAHPPGEGTHAAQNQPAIEGRGDRSALVLNTADPLEKIVFNLRHDNSSQNVTMTAEIFGRGMQNQINAEIEWALQRWRPGIIANRNRPGSARNFRGSCEIYNF